MTEQLAAGSGDERNPPDRFVSWAMEYHVTGARGWSELTLAEQDEYLLDCFAGEAHRAATEARLRLFDRVAGSIAQHLLGVYQQYDTNDGVAHYSPPTPRIAARVIEQRRRVLAGTALGRRLEAALDRAEGKPSSCLEAELRFYSVAPATKGMEILDENCSGGTDWVVPQGFDKWNNFEVLDRLHYQHTSERWRASKEDQLESLLSASPHQFSANQVDAPVLSDAEPADAPDTRLAGTNARDNSWLVYIAAFLAASLLGGALVSSLPSWYYTLLRVAVCVSLVWLAVRALGNEMNNAAATLGIGALIYNPLMPLHLGKAAWQLLNAATLAGMLVCCVILWRRERLIQ